MSAQQKTDDTDDAELDPELAVLQEENRRLRQAYQRTKQVQYRRTAIGLAGVGMVAIAGSLLLPDVRDILVVLGAIGVFSGLMTVYLTPDRILTASVSEGLFHTHADTVEALVEELGLQDDHVYVPTAEAGGSVRLFRPQHVDYEIPETLDSVFLVDEPANAKGIAVPPTGNPLYESFAEATVVRDDASTQTVADAVSDALVEQFEIAHSVTHNLESGRLTVTVSGIEPAGLDRVDHPIVSLFGVAIAQAIESPVELASMAPQDSRFTLTWDETPSSEA